MEVTLNLDEQFKALDITEDRQKIHHDENAGETILKHKGVIVQGVHYLAFLESINSPIEDHYPLKLEDIRFESPVWLQKGVKETATLKYNFKRLKDSPFYLHHITVIENENTVMTGKVYTTDNYGAFQMVLNQTGNFHDLFKMKEKTEMPYIADISLKQRIENCCNTFHIDYEKYRRKYGENVSGIFSDILVPAKLVNAYGNENLTYAFKKYSSELYAKSSEGEMKISGNKREKSKLNMLEFVLKDLKNNVLSGSEAAAFAF